MSRRMEQSELEISPTMACFQKLPNIKVSTDGFVDGSWEAIRIRGILYIIIGLF